MRIVGGGGREFGVTEEELIGGTRRLAISGARSVFCHLATRELGATGHLSGMIGDNVQDIVDLGKGQSFTGERENIFE